MDMLGKRINRRGQSAYTLVEIMIVVAIIAVLLAVSLPNYLRSRINTRQTICVNNLRQIDAAIDRWVFENGHNVGITVSPMQESEIHSYIHGGVPQCPSSGTYVIGTIGVYPQVTCTVEGHSLVN